MAIIKCPECGKEISNTCDKCIHCGYQIKKPVTTYSKPSNEESRASKIIEREYNEKQIAGVIGGILTIILGIVMLCCCAFPDLNAYMGVLVGFGIFVIILGIILLVYSLYRLKNY
ncbi:MAG: hypothetical protein WCS80_01635 [Bacilli bacterium]